MSIAGHILYICLKPLSWYTTLVTPLIINFYDMLKNRKRNILRNYCTNSLSVLYLRKIALITFSYLK